MAKRYTYETTISWGGDEPTAEHDVKVEYTVAWGSPETGRFGKPEDYDPGSGSEVENIKLLTVDGKLRPWDMGYGFLSDDAFAEMVEEKLEAHHSDMIIEAGAEDDGRREEAAEYRAEARREAFEERL